jgi:hypothetical protein
MVLLFKERLSENPTVPSNRGFVSISDTMLLVCPAKVLDWSTFGVTPGYLANNYKYN